MPCIYTAASSCSGSIVSPASRLVSSARRSRRSVRPLKIGERASNWSASVWKKRRSSSVGEFAVLRRPGASRRVDTAVAETGRKPVTASMTSATQSSNCPVGADASLSSPSTRGTRCRPSSLSPADSPAIASSRRSMVSKMTSAICSLKGNSPWRTRSRMLSTGCTMATARSSRQIVASPLMLCKARNRLPIAPRSAGVLRR